MKRKYSRYLIIMFLLIGIYPLVSIFNASPIIPIKKNTLQTFDGSYYSKNGHHQYLGNNQYRFSTKLGMENVYDGSKYIPYIYNDLENSILFANSKLTFYDWYAVLEQDNEIRIDDLRWVVQYFQDQAGGRWVELDLYNHYYYEPIITEKSMTIIQAYDDGSSYMNVSYFVSNYENVKVSIDFLSGGDYELRFNWQLSGMQGVIIENMSTRSFSFSDVIISCNDTDSDIGFNYDWVVNEKKLDIYLGSYNILAGEKIFIDPTFSAKQSTDANDFFATEQSGGYSIGTADYAYSGFQTAARHKKSFVGFETDINETIDSIGNSTMSIFTRTEALEVDEYIAVGIYNKSDADGFWDETEATGSPPLAFEQNITYINASKYMPVVGNQTFSVDDILTQWKTIHNADITGRTAVAFIFTNGTGCDWNTADEAGFYEGSRANVTERMTLTFDYVLGEVTTTTTTAVTTTTTGDLGESFTPESEFFLIHFLNNLALYLVQYWFVILVVSGITIAVIKVLYR